MMDKEENGEEVEGEGKKKGEDERCESQSKREEGSGVRCLNMWHVR